MKKLSIGQLPCLITLIVSLLFCVQTLWGQTREVTVTLDLQEVPLKSVMNEIERQTGLLFLYTDDIDTDRRVSLRVDRRPLDEALAQLFHQTEITWRVNHPNIVLTKRPAAARPAKISGVVRDAQGEAVIGTTILVRGTTVGTTSGIDGSFVLTIPASVDHPELAVSFIGYEPQTIAVGNRSMFEIELRSEAVAVESVVVTALGIKRSEKALSYNVQQVNAESIT